MAMDGRELNSTDEPDLDNRTVLYMSDFAIFSINGPLVILNLMTNIFFGFCLMTRKTQQVKQPLSILLGSIVCCTILYVLSVTLMTCVLEWVKSDVAAMISYTIVLLLMRVNMTSYVWLMFYYHIMIVPSQQVLFLWVKKNIKSVIYVVMLLDSLIFLCDASFEITSSMDYFRFNNGTEFVFIDIGIALVSIVYIYLFLCLFVMMISCFATAHYLNKHMKNLSVSDGSLSNPRLHSQIRVTVTGILQGVLCFLCTICDLVDVMSFYLSPYFEFDVYIHLTAINLYIFGTTINLAVGQTLFRERAVLVWKAVKKRLCKGKSSKDLRPPGNLVTTTSLSIIESSGVDTAMSL
ncbi:uncharacterized protein LOC132449176 [Gadus macrocephalus]|uniref:uncharacterized protein LOC132449176 n=1 Tax=Gadus macrocephalus TaxID=80720 RepID=UPI0028CB2C62|nr:uncharacterized protein LOC132449176 [Gadus macrocephalus]